MQIAQQPIPDPPLGNPPQVRLDPPQDRDGFGPLPHVQHDREETRKPAHRAGEIQLSKEVFAPMALQIDGHCSMAQAVGTGQGQRGQQHLLRTGTQPPWHLTQEGPGLCRTQVLLNLLDRALAGLFPGGSEGHGRRRCGLLQPVGSLLLQHLRLRIGLQALRPRLEAAPTPYRTEGRSLQHMRIGPVQVSEQHTPGDGIDHQMVTDQQQAPGRCPCQTEEHGADQHPGLQSRLACT